MRELDDALARLARRQEALRRRTEQSTGEDRSAAEEVTEAVQRVVARHPDITVTVLIARGREAATMHIAWSEGKVVAIPVAGPSSPAIGPGTSAGTTGTATGTNGPATGTNGPATGTAHNGTGAATTGSAPSWPMSVKTVPSWAAASDGLTEDPAARLADLIRRDPSLLGDPEDGA
nr:hypothetical protein [Micromonospora sp. DSM 115978]